MRAKIITVFTVVVLVVGVLAFALTRASLHPGSPRTDAGRALVAAEALLRVQALEVERWLEARAADPKMRDPFSAGTDQARRDQATGVANEVMSAAGKAPAMSALDPTLVVLVDAKGTSLGRDGSQLLRGDDLGGIYPALRAGLEKGVGGSDVWVTPARHEQMLVSWAPIRGEGGQVIGGLVMGTALSDGRLTTVASETSGASLLFEVKEGEGYRIVARSNGPDLASAIDAKVLETGANTALSSGQAAFVDAVPTDLGVKVGPLGGYGDGRRALLVSVARADVPAATTLLFPFLGAIALGIVLVAVAGQYLGLWISRPVEELEEGLLAIMNGRTDLRFEIEHAEFGGLVSRLNSLLNQMLDVQEDEETDAEGHPAHGARAKDFQEALAVDETLAERETAGEDGKALRAEDDDAYYQRVFDDYIGAKKTVGDPVDHITQEAFIARIMSSEREMAHKHGKPVRYKVEVRGKEVVLLAVPLA